MVDATLGIKTFVVVVIQKAIQVFSP